jgi:hypothetical protein
MIWIWRLRLIAPQLQCFSWPPILRISLRRSAPGPRYLPPRKYLVNASVSREESATPIIKRHRMGYDLNGDPVSVPVSTTGLPIKSEADVLAASAELSSPDDGVVIDAFP